MFNFCENLDKYSTVLLGIISILLTIIEVIEARLVIGIIAILLLINTHFIRETQQRKLSIIKLEEILETCAGAVREYQNRKEFNTLRANIMVPNYKKDRLEIIASYNMEGAPDEDITFAFGTGCCGEAFDSQTTAIGDLEQVYKEDWATTRNKYGSSPWGIRETHFLKTKDLKSILSIPLVYDNKILGVLNFDDKVNLETAKLKEEKLLMIIGGYVCYIVNILNSMKGVDK